MISYSSFLRTQTSLESPGKQKKHYFNQTVTKMYKEDDFAHPFRFLSIPRLRFFLKSLSLSMLLIANTLIIETTVMELKFMIIFMEPLRTPVPPLPC